MNPSAKASFSLILGAMFAASAVAQCTSIPNRKNYELASAPSPVPTEKITITETKVDKKGDVTTTTTKVIERLSPTPVPPPKAPENIEIPFPEKGVQLKVSLDNDIDSGYLRNRDSVSFTVVEDGILFDKDENPDYRCVVVPKDSKVYGVVDKSRGRQLFNFKGGAQLFIYLEKLTLGNGITYPLRFTYPLDSEPDRVNGQAKIVKKKDKALRQCENKKSPTEDCIIGRRTRVIVDPAIIATGADGAVLFSDGTDKQVARISILAYLFKATGLSALVNQPNAGFRARTVFPATLFPATVTPTSNELIKTIWRELPKKETPK